MNQQQIKYALKRAEEIYKVRYSKITEAYTHPAVRLDNKDILQALKDDAFEVRENPRNTYGDNIRNYVIFDVETEAVVDKEKIKDKQSVLKDEYDKLTDELMLGDQQEALDMLRKFDV